MRIHLARMIGSLAVVSLVWLGSPGPATADLIVGGVNYTNPDLVIIHASTEDLFAGGESINGCVGSGCSGVLLTRGDTSGFALVEIKETVYHGTSPTGAPVTIYTYDLHNDNQSSPIWSFHISTTVIPIGTNSPDNWGFTPPGTEWVWTNNGLSSDALSMGQTDSFAAVVNGLDAVQFSPGLFDITSDHTLVRCAECTWVISAPQVVPEPGTMLLLGAGMVGIGFVRRRARSRQPR